MCFLQLGINSYIALARGKNRDWRILVRTDPTDGIDSRKKSVTVKRRRYFTFLTPWSCFRSASARLRPSKTCAPSFLGKLRDPPICTSMRKDHCKRICALNSAICSSTQLAQVASLAFPRLLLASSGARYQHVRRREQHTYGATVHSRGVDDFSGHIVLYDHERQRSVSQLLGITSQRFDFRW